jgi:localization factor PodJL
MGLEDAMRKVVDRLDASEAKLAGIGNIERNISDLSQEFSKARANAMDVAERAAKNALRELQSARNEGPLMPGPAMPRAAAPMPPVVAAPSLEPPMPPATERALPGESLQIRSIRTAAPRAVPAPEPQTAARFSRPVAVAESEELPADYPLEPGSGVPHARQTPIAQRIAQSEAAVAEIELKPDDAGQRASDYIAAARRAAQAAAAEANAEGQAPGSKFSVGALFARGRRALLLGLAVTLIAFGAVRFIDFGALNPFAGETKTAPAARKDSPAPAAPAPQTPPPATQTPEAAPTPPQQRSVLPGTVDPTAAVAPPAGNIAPQINPSLLAQQPDPSVTNQIAPIVPVRQQQANVSAAPIVNEALPAGIGNAALRNAALQGDPNAAIEIADRFLNGTGVAANPAESLRWLERAAAKGSPVAAFRVGMAYEKGLGVAKDRTQARTLYTLAADSGHVKAMHNLAVLIAETPAADGKPDFAAALVWFRKAAEFGLRDSQYNLGVLYARGLGGPQNLTESYRWFSLAANQGDPDAAKKRDEVAARLDQQTLVAARLAVQTWQPQTPNEAINASAPRPEWLAEAAPQKTKPKAKKAKSPDR